MILLCWWKRYSICLTIFPNLYELFPPFTCGNNIANLFGVNIFNSVAVVFLLGETISLFYHHFFSVSNISYLFSPSSGGMLDKSSSFLVILSEIVSSDYDLLSFLYISNHLSCLKPLINKLLGSHSFYPFLLFLHL